MLKFTSENNQGSKIYFLGLSRGNINRLTQGQPIKVNLKELGGPDLTVAILFGETEQILFNELKACGLIPAEVKYHEAESGTIQKVMVRRDRATRED